MENNMKKKTTYYDRYSVTCHNKSDLL